MPGLSNNIGSIQMEADIAAFKHPVFPPYSAGNEITALTLINGRNLVQVAPFMEIQWRAYAVDHLPGFGFNRTSVGSGFARSCASIFS